jgi:RNA polymerase sigma-70 factor (ECF subfamily)
MVQDKYLVWQFNRGRREALHQIYEKHKDRLMALAAALLTNVALAEDVVHDVFIGFIQSEGKFQLTGSLKAYLTTCVANAARNLNKAEYQRRHASLDDIVPPTAKRSGDPEFNAVFGEESGRLAWALKQLPYEQREVLILRVYSHMKFTAIAAQQNTSIHTAQGRYRYALDKLRELLTQGSSRHRSQAATQTVKLRKLYI